MKYPEWTLIDWDGNRKLKLKCWRKSFHGGDVSVGAGDFQLIVYSYGANSDYSLSSTRWQPNGQSPITEKEAMDMVDKNNGCYHMFHNSETTVAKIIDMDDEDN